MTAIEESQDRVSNLRSQPDSKYLSSPETAMEFKDRDSRKKGGVEEHAQQEAESESGESSEDLGESPKSVVGKWRMNKIGSVHSQVLKIREEDSHLGEDIVVIAKDNFINAGGFGGQNAQIRFVSATVDVMLSSRLILPSSPLGGRTSS